MAEIEDRWRDLGEFIREQRRVGQLSLRKLSEMAGISNPYLSQIERGLRKPSAEILRQIAGALQISAETLYVRAGILDERDGVHDLVAEIHRDPFLDEDQKRTLTHIYLSFREAFVAARLDQGLPLGLPSVEDGPLDDDGGVDDGPLEDGPLDDGPLDDGPLDDGPLDDDGSVDDGSAGAGPDGSVAGPVHPSADRPAAAPDDAAGSDVEPPPAGAGDEAGEPPTPAA